MSDDHAITCYLAEVAARPVADAATQLGWARAIDRAQRAFNQALLACPSARLHFQRLVCRTGSEGNELRWLARRVATSAASTVPADTKPEDELRVFLQSLRLNGECMAGLIAAVRAQAGQDDAQTQVFLAAAGGARARIRAATEQLVQANQRLVVTLARQYRYAPVPFMDLVQEGNLGLLRAIERFDPEHGARVSTYALWWVRRAMVYAIARQGHAVRPPVALYWSARQIQRGLSRLDTAQGRRSTLQEAAQALGISVASIHESQSVLTPAQPLEVSTDGHDGQLRSERLADPMAADPEQGAADQDLRRAVRALLAHLPERQARILRLRFGIEVHDDCTLEQIARQQGVTRERIRQIEAQALEALRALGVAEDLRGCL